MQQDWNKIRGQSGLNSKDSLDPAFLSDHIAQQEMIYSFMGDIGSHFLKEMTGLTVSEDADPDLDDMTARYSFSHAEPETSQRILYGMPAFESPLSFFQARTHEFEHAIQHAQIPAMHAVPGNPATEIILSPRDYCLMMELMERAAFTCEKYLTTLFKKAVAPQSEFSPAEEAILQTPEITLPRFASIILEHTSCYEAADALAFYHDKALRIYEQEIELRQERNPCEILTFARLDDDDIRMIGKRWGVDLFSPAPYIQPYNTGSLKLAPEASARLAWLENRLGFGNHENLLTLTEALVENGKCRAQFLSENLSRKKNNPECPMT